MSCKPLKSSPSSRLGAILLLVVGSLLLPNFVQAEYFGLINGRLPPSGKISELSVELGFVSGQYSEIDYNNPGLRINYQLRDNIQVFGTLGNTSIGSEEETTFGAGGFINMGKLLPFSESVAFKGSAHTVKMYSAGRPGRAGSTRLERCGAHSWQFNWSWDDPGFDYEPDGCTLVTDPGSSGSPGSTSSVTALSLEMLLGGKQIDELALANGIAPSWYANIGLHSFNGSDKDAAVGIGGGLVLPLKSGEAYVGMDMIDDTMLGFGFRYKVQ